nr:unnamed protein product [Amyelois transitella]
MSSLMIRTDVTAVKLHKNYIIAGIGSDLNVFNKNSNSLLQRFRCLNGQKIYGIIPLLQSNKLLVYGGKQFVVVLEHGEFVRLLDPVVCDDWLHSGIWINDNEIALLTAHNVVQIWDTQLAILKSKQISTDNSILYSGTLHKLQDDILVFAGTVFSEVIIHSCKTKMPLHHLKGHRGVIFSISCDLQNGIIVTTSDDRSVCIWGIDNKKSLANIAHDTIEFWRQAEIVRVHEIYGHTARVMRSCIINDLVISVGEDSAICYWNNDGKLLKKVATHQNGGVWSVDADDHHLVTGGGDGSVILHPLTSATDQGKSVVLNIDRIPKKTIFTARRNIAILNDTDELIFYNVIKENKAVYKLKHDSTYKLLSLSSCKQMIAVTDMNGNLDVFVETCKEDATLINIVNLKLDLCKVLSLHWAGNRHLVLGCEEGLIKVIAYSANKVEDFANFTLPSCKERWLTAANIDSTNAIIIVGDRCGNIHVYKRGIKTPLKSFSKVHGRYGPTSIVMKKNGFVSTGRDGTVKFFDLNVQDVSNAKYMSSKDMEFHWVEKFIDKNEKMICGFQERIFVVYDLKSDSKLVEAACGGGHRSWDVVRYIERVNDNYEECIKFMYVKNSDIHLHTFYLSKIISTNIVNGSHYKEINCLKSLIIDGSTFFISGGEDTTLRISLKIGLDLQDKIIFKHLSNVRTLKTKQLDENKYILVSAGGRAQICVKLLNFYTENEELVVKSQDLIDFMIKGPEKERKGKQSWKNCTIDFDPETRIMAIDLFQIDDYNFIIFAGCSDAVLRIFKLNINVVDFKLITEVKHHKTCILKTHYLKFVDKDLLVTASTRGEVIFWEIKDDEINIEPIFTTHTNKSGINSFDIAIISDKHVLFASGGDDNVIHLNLLEYTEEHKFKVLDKWSTDKYHCSQVTGLVLKEDILLCTSIDQRVTMCKWSFSDHKIKCDFLLQNYSDVSDIQGLDLVDFSSNKATICVYGKGMEIIELPFPG